MGFYLSMVMSVTVLGAYAVSFAMNMLRHDPPKAANKENIDEAVSVREYEEIGEALGGEQEECNTSIEEVKAFLMDKEMELQNVNKENEHLRSKILLGSEKTVELQDRMIKLQAQLKEAYGRIEDADEKIVELQDGLVKLQAQLKEAYGRIEDGDVREKETSEKLRLLKLELENAKERETNTLQQLEAVKAAKMVMETKIEKDRLQTEQWKKAVDAAAMILQAATQNSVSNKTLEERSA